MAGLLSHSLAAMAFCGLLLIVTGNQGISYGLFIAGIMSMVIELDLDDLSENTRSPIGHSIFFAVVWVLIFSVIFQVLSSTGFISNTLALELTLAIIAAYVTHLIIDSFTRERIYTFPKGKQFGSWFIRLPKGSPSCWEHWTLFTNTRFQRFVYANEDPKLNAMISIPSLMAIIVYVALMPLPF